MRIREHKGFGHGLRPGDVWDMNCRSCRRDKAEGVEPVITGEGTVRDMLYMSASAHERWVLDKLEERGLLAGVIGEAAARFVEVLGGI